MTRRNQAFCIVEQGTKGWQHEIFARENRINHTLAEDYPSLQTYTFNLPADILSDAAHTTITLEYDSWLIPAEIGQSADQRRLAVDWIRFERAASP